MGLTSYNGKQGMCVFLSSHHRRCCNWSHGVQHSPCSCELWIGLWPKKEWKARWESAIEQNSSEIVFFFNISAFQMLKLKQEKDWGTVSKPVRLNYLLNECEWILISCFSPVMLGQVLGPTELLLRRIHARGWSWWLGTWISKCIGWCSSTGGTLDQSNRTRSDHIIYYHKRLLKYFKSLWMFPKILH